MLKHKVGDTVLIQTQEWMDAQEKDEDGNIHGEGERVITPLMQHFAGKTAKILSMGKKSYDLDIGVRGDLWEEWMFDPRFHYRPEDKPLSAEEALRAMLDGDRLYDKDGVTHAFTDEEINIFCSGLYRRKPVKRKRDMTHSRLEKIQEKLVEIIDILKEYD